MAMLLVTLLAMISSTMKLPKMMTMVMMMLTVSVTTMVRILL